MNNIPKLKETFVNMRAEIVKLLKKKRRTFSQISSERSISQFRDIKKNDLNCGELLLDKSCSLMSSRSEIVKNDVETLEKFSKQNSENSNLYDNHHQHQNHQLQNSKEKFQNQENSSQIFMSQKASKNFNQENSSNFHTGCNCNNSNFQTPEKFVGENENFQKSTEESVLKKRHFKQDYERELELFLPSKFFVLTNVFFKSKHLKV